MLDEIQRYLLDIPVDSNDNKPLVITKNSHPNDNKSSPSKEECTSILVDTNYNVSMNEIVFENYPSVLYLYIQPCAFQNCSEKLTITKMNKLRVIAIENQSFKKTKKVEIKGLSFHYFFSINRPSCSYRM